MISQQAKNLCIDMASLRYSNRTGSAYYVVFGEAYYVGLVSLRL